MTVFDRRLVRAFVDVVGSTHVIDDPQVAASFAADWTGRYVGATPLVVRPGSTAEVAAIMGLCREHGVAIVPQGGNTGLVGGGIAMDGELVVSLRPLERVVDVDPVSGQLTAEAGATLAAVRAAAVAAQWAYGVDFASRDSATIGGNVASNAGGLRVLRYGDTRAQVLGVEAVLGTGDTVSHLGGLLKDNTGYALPALLCGSEGTLGVVCAVRLRLVPPAPTKAVALVGFDRAADAVVAAGELRRTLPSLSAAELMVAAGIDLVCRVTGAPRPLGAPYAAYLLVEASGVADPTDDLGDAIAGLEGVRDAVVAVDPGPVAALWRYREAHTEAINTLGPPHKHDVTLPRAALADAVEQMPAIVAAVDPEATTWLFGHVGDGNLHVNVTGIAPDDDRVDDVILRWVAEAKGSISAEHGIGRAKRPWLHLNRTGAELSAFSSIKRALDPDGICNPGVLLAPVSAGGQGRGGAGVPQRVIASAKTAERSR